MAATPLRPELVAYGYRMLASVGAAQDLADQAYQRAGPAADRAALFQAATAVCLGGPASQRRPLPTDLGGPSLNPQGTLVEFNEVTWLEPFPDVLLGDTTGPVHLELVAALQQLPPRQRAVLVLRDLQGWPVGDVATVLDTSRDAVNGVLRRARSRFAVPQVVPPSDEAQRELLARYATAFEQYDLPAILQLFDENAVWEMPPFASWFQGVRNIGLLISTHCPAERPGDQVLVPTKANGQPAFAVYMRDPVTRVHRAFQIQVLTLAVTGVVHAIAFFDLSLFDAFGLPQLLTELPDMMSSVHDATGPAQQRPEVTRRRR
jgi:RNA polymerase sigma-70 factor (ECF subfamily)